MVEMERLSLKSLGRKDCDGPFSAPPLDAFGYASAATKESSKTIFWRPSAIVPTAQIEFNEDRQEEKKRKQIARELKPISIGIELLGILLGMTQRCRIQDQLGILVLLQIGY